jgi:hypothetical protein
MFLFVLCFVVFTYCTGREVKMITYSTVCTARTIVALFILCVRQLPFSLGYELSFDLWDFSLYYFEY